MQPPVSVTRARRVAWDVSLTYVMAPLIGRPPRQVKESFFFDKIMQDLLIFVNVYIRNERRELGTPGLHEENGCSLHICHNALARIMTYVENTHSLHSPMSSQLATFIPIVKAVMKGSVIE